MPKQNKIPDLPKTISDITYMRTTGMRSKYSIAQWLMNQFNISKVYAYKVIKLMEEELTEAYKEDALNQLTNTIARFEAMAEEAMNQGNINAAIKAEEHIAKLKGLYTIKIEQTNKQDIPLFSDEDLEGDND